MNGSEPETAPPSVYAHLAMWVDQLAAIAWQKLGLQPDMMTGKIEVNLPEAKVAIDLVAHVGGILEGQLDTEDRRQIQGLIRDLRVNFVQKSQQEGT